jgi:fermentation-respiration switch protein FrsA (DUF1100 family)
MKTIGEMKLPPKLMYPFVKLGARLFGHFSLDSFSPAEAVKQSTTPIIFIHGTSDDFVPYYMSEKMYAECTAKKSLIPIEGAGHGLAYIADGELYLLGDFCGNGFTSANRLFYDDEAVLGSGTGILHGAGHDPRCFCRNRAGSAGCRRQDDQ